MPPVPLGYVPEPFTMTLASDSDFRSAIIRNPLGWTDDTIIELRLIAPGATPIVWTATLSDTLDNNGNITVPRGDASFTINKTAVAAAINAGVKTFRLHYVTGGDLLWGKGPIYVA